MYGLFVEHTLGDMTYWEGLVQKCRRHLDYCRLMTAARPASTVYLDTAM